VGLNVVIELILFVIQFTTISTSYKKID